MEEKKRTAHLHVRLTEEEKEKLKKLASQCGLSVSDFIRCLIHNVEKQLVFDGGLEDKPKDTKK